MAKNNTNLQNSQTPPKEKKNSFYENNGTQNENVKPFFCLKLYYTTILLLAKFQI